MPDMFDGFPEKMEDLRILVSNDDGINAPGLKVMEKVARALSNDIWVVAPELEQSGAGHSLTLQQPLRIRRLSPRRFAVNGTPTDCVLLAVKKIIPHKRKKINLILSGVNRGANLAEDVTYSGTIAAAMEGTLLEIPSIAFSLCVSEGKQLNWKTVEAYAPALVRKLVALQWQKNTLININFPDLPPEKIRGVKVAPTGQRQINEKVNERLDPKGRPYYWVGTPLKDDYDRPGVDLAWINEGYITVTPLHLDLTDYRTLESIREHFETHSLQDAL